MPLNYTPLWELLSKSKIEDSLWNPAAWCLNAAQKNMHKIFATTENNNYNTRLNSNNNHNNKQQKKKHMKSFN